MRSGQARRRLVSMVLCAGAFFSSACFGGGAPPAQATPTAGSPTTAASPVASPPVLPSPVPLASPAASPSPQQPAAGPEQTYTVEPGDTLAIIAQKQYGDPTLWRRIYDANRAAIGDNPDAIKVGTQLRIPPKE